MNRPPIQSLSADTTSYMSDDLWLASMWGPIILKIKDRNSQADDAVEADKAIPIWNSYSIFRCIHGLGVYADGKQKRGLLGMYFTYCLLSSHTVKTGKLVSAMCIDQSILDAWRVSKTELLTLGDPARAPTYVNGTWGHIMVCWNAAKKKGMSINFIA